MKTCTPFFSQELLNPGKMWTVVKENGEQKGGGEKRGESIGACNELILCSVSSSPLIYYYRLTLRESYTLHETVKRQKKQKQDRTEVDVCNEGELL